MAAPKPDRTIFLLGKYLGLAFLMPSGAVAGYLIGLWLQHYIHWPGLRGVCIVVGLVATLVKLFQELLRDSNQSEEGKSSQ
jgi:MFS family permease